MSAGITAASAVSAVGHGQAAHLAAMRTLETGLAPCAFPGADLPCHVGAVAGLDDIAFPQALGMYDNRASRIALAGLAADGFGDAVTAAQTRWGRARVGLVMGTSTAGVERLETAYRARTHPDAPLPGDYEIRHHNDHNAVTAFLTAHLGIEGPAMTVSTACSSSAKAIIDAWQMIHAGLADAVIAGGVDSLCLTSLYGFEALELVSRQPCRPMDADRDGLSIGEGAGFLLLERGAGGPRLSGYGESSDATSMSTPPPDGEGAARAMRAALARAGLAPEDIDFVKLHGTATPTNDSSETAAVATVFPATVPAASLKGLVGHTLGAAGALEPVMCLAAMQAGLRPGNAGLTTLDPAIGCTIQQDSAAARMDHVACNAFGFGGSNACLVLSRT